MSRDYGAYPRFGLRKRPRARQRTGCLPLLVALLAVVVAAFFWGTRSTARMESFIPREPAYEAYTTDLLQTAMRVAGSRVWDAIPDDRPEYDLRYRLAGGLPLPDWMIHNLFHGLCHVSGNDMENFGDVVVVTQLTRVGNVLERFNFLVGAIQKDHAGGLNLRRVGDTGVAHYAVRGRVMLISPSREALIRALTLHRDEAAPAERLQALRAALRDADVVLEVRGAGGGAAGLAPLLEFTDTARIAVRAETQTLRCSVEAQLAPEVQAQYQPLLAGLRPLPLRRPHDAMLSASWNLGMPLGKAWAGVNELRDEPLVLAGNPDADGAEDADNPPDVLGFLGQLAGVFGGQGRLMLRGVDQNEMLPAPEFVALLEADAAQLHAMMTALPPWLEGDGAMTQQPFYDAETQTVRMPLVGGPSLELTVAVYGGEAMLGTSRPASLGLMLEPPVNDTLNQPGNLYINAMPAPLAAELAAAGLQFAEAGMLRGQTAESFGENAEYWQKMAEQISSVSVLAAYEDGALTLNLQVVAASGQ